MRSDVDRCRPTSSDSGVNVSGGGGDVESLSDAVQRELERDLVVQLQARLHEGDVTN